MPRWLWLIIAALIIGVLVAVLPLPGLVSTLGYVAAVICAVVGLVLLVVSLVRGTTRL